MSYRWHIDENVLEGGTMDVQGPACADAEITHNRARFSLHDDDGHCYMRGTIWGDYSGFEPLDDYGFSWGCTEVRLNGQRI